MNEEYLYATKFHNGILEEIEEKSFICWAGGERPTEWKPCTSDGYLIMERIGAYTFYLIYGDPDSGETVLNGPDFVKKCSQLVPK